MTSVAQNGHGLPSLPGHLPVRCHHPPHREPGAERRGGGGGGGRLLAYDLHEDLLPVLAGLEAAAQGRALGEGLQLLLQEALPAQVVRVGLEGGLALVRGLWGTRASETGGWLWPPPPSQATAGLFRGRCSQFLATCEQSVLSVGSEGQANPG